MRKHTVCLLTLALGGTCLAQQWEVGAAGGLEIYKNLTVTRGSLDATAGFKPGVAASVFAAQNLYQHLGGEFRYTIGLGDMKVSSGGTEATFAAQTHAVHYDLLFYGTRREAKVRPFVAAGGGVKVYRGTGKEQESQPLGQFALLTKTQQVEGLITVGGGVKLQVGRRSFVYIEARDYITRTPKNVIAPFTGSSISGWMHGYLPMLGVSIGF